jgi:hypothetical protein
VSCIATLMQVYTNSIFHFSKQKYFYYHEMYLFLNVLLWKIPNVCKIRINMILTLPTALPTSFTHYFGVNLISSSLNTWICVSKRYGHFFPSKHDRNTILRLLKLQKLPKINWLLMVSIPIIYFTLIFTNLQRLGIRPSHILPVP